MKGPMRRRYYLLTDDKQIAQRWYLKGPIARDGEAIDPRIFTCGRPVDLVGNLTIPLRRRGEPLAFTLADFDMPVIRHDIGEELASLSPNEVQIIPAKVDGVAGAYSILNVTRTVECLDEARSDVTYWADEHGRPDKIGQYMIITKLSVDPTTLDHEHIFRVARWNVAIVISEEARQVLAKAHGAVFRAAS